MERIIEMCHQYQVGNMSAEELFEAVENYLFENRDKEIESVDEIDNIRMALDAYEPQAAVREDDEYCIDEPELKRRIDETLSKIVARQACI